MFLRSTGKHEKGSEKSESSESWILLTLYMNGAHCTEIAVSHVERVLKVSPISADES